MKGTTTINAQDFVVLDAPEISNPEDPNEITTWHLNLDPHLGYFKVKSLFHPLFSLHQAEGDFKYDTLMNQSETPQKKQIGMALMSCGRTMATFGGEHSIEAGAGEGSLNYNPGMSERYRLFPGKTILTTYFDFNAEYFNHLLVGHNIASVHEIDVVRSKIENGLFTHTPVAVTAAHHRIITDILTCPMKGNLRNLMLEGSLQQMIALQLHSMAEIRTVESHIDSRDKEVMHGIKEYLDASFMEDHSLLDLSRQFGVNQYKLKKNFKALFGVPVIEYVYNLRMQYAHALLYDKRMYVAEVAPIVGYKNANHFATAFKRKFGVCPSSLKTNR